MSEVDLDSPDAFEGGAPDEGAPAGTGDESGRLLTRPALAKLLRMDVKTVDKFMREGCPVAVKGDAARRLPHKLDAADFVRWWIEREREIARTKTTVIAEGEGAFDEEKVRDKAAQADLRELQVAKLKRELVPIADVHSYVDEIAGLIRAAAQAVHTQVRDLTEEQREDVIKATDAMLAQVHAYVPPETDASDVFEE